MRIKYNRDQKIKGNLTRNFDKDYAFLDKALDRSGDIVKNVFYVGDTADIQSIMEEQTDANTDSDMFIGYQAFSSTIRALASSLL